MNSASPRTAARRWRRWHGPTRRRCISASRDVLFHAEQHNGNSQMLIDNFTSGRYIGLPLLQWFGMTVEPRQAAEHGEKPFPHMLRWVR